MESIIYVAEATALIESIHILKQWLYDGTIQLLIPTCTLHTVEEAFKASLITKDASKQQPPAKQSGGRVKKEYPLFDINPRTAWEFIERVKTGKEAVGVTFQQENEVFTQWKNEDEKELAKEEAALPPPSSFADALLRKLVVKDNSKEPKAPAKPKLTARTKDHKPAWKIEKTPTLSASGLTDRSKSLLSCILWRVHEAEKNPLQPTSYKLLVNDQNINKKAHDFGLITITTDSLKAEHIKAQQDHDARNAKGQLEQEFPEIMALSHAFVPGDDNDSNADKFDFLHVSQTNGKLDHQTGHPAPAEMDKVEDIVIKTPSMTEQDVAIHQGDTTSSKSESGNRSSTGPSILAENGQLHGILQNAEQEMPLTLPSEKAQSPEKEIQEAKIDSDLESDEEIIVFNPRNRRGSGPLSSRSRPGSSGGFVTKIYKAGIPASPSLVFPPTPTFANDTTAMRDTGDNSAVPNFPARSLNDSSLATSLSTLTVKSPIESKLKAESPIFTPGKPILVSPLGTPISISSPLQSNPSSPLPPTGPRNAGSRYQRGGIIPKPDNNEFVRMQKESSQRIIQRQREAIQRQSKAADGQVMAQTPNSPRLIQMEPTDNPTVIDPDAFDRSYIVQPPTNTTNVTQRQTLPRRQGRGHHHRNPAKDRSKQNGQVTETSTDSATTPDFPRGSGRGRGKLWVP